MITDKKNLIYFETYYCILLYTIGRNPKKVLRNFNIDMRFRFLRKILRFL